jgi:membrane-bound lytic murein transglycosylase D
MLAGLSLGLAIVTASGAGPAKTPGSPDASQLPGAAAVNPPTPATRNGREIYARFREGLADPSCGPDTSQRWKRHFAGAPKRLVSRNDDVLPLFGYVVDALRQANLPTEYALIPFVESGYRPGARSSSGPAGLWQFIALTARNHHVPIRAGYDGRLSPVDSTQAAVRYLKTLHGMFAGDWRLAVMAFNAGEYRVLGALKRSGQRAMDAQPENLVGLSGITQAYVRKLHALSCVLDQADDRKEWQRSLDRPVPLLAATTLPTNIKNLDTWAARQGLDAATVRRINPAFPNGRVARTSRELQVLAPATASDTPALVAAATDPATTTLADAATAVTIEMPPGATQSSVAPRSHTVVRGDSVWRLARRYGLGRHELLERNDLTASSVLRPGMVLKIDADPR